MNKEEAQCRGREIKRENRKWYYRTKQMTESDEDSWCVLVWDKEGWGYMEYDLRGREGSPSFGE